MTISIREEYRQAIDLLTMEERGELLTAIACISAGAECPEISKAAQLALVFIVADAERTHAEEAAKEAEEEAAREAREARRAEIAEKRREAGRRGGSGKQSEANGSKAKQTEAKNEFAKQTEANESKDKQNENLLEFASSADQTEPVNITPRARAEIVNIDNSKALSNRQDINNLKLKEKKEKEKKKPPGFVPPTVKDVENLCVTHGYSIDPEAFVSYYEANGWMVGKNKMKSWTAAVASWNAREKKQTAEREKQKKSGFNNYTGRNYDGDELARKLVRLS